MPQTWVSWQCTRRGVDSEVVRFTLFTSSNHIKSIYIIWINLTQTRQKHTKSYNIYHSFLPPSRSLQASYRGPRIAPPLTTFGLQALGASLALLVDFSPLRLTRRLQLLHWQRWWILMKYIAETPTDVELCLCMDMSLWTCIYHMQWIGLRENLQETIDFSIKYGAFLWIFP